MRAALRPPPISPYQRWAHFQKRAVEMGKISWGEFKTEERNQKATDAENAGSPKARTKYSRQQNQGNRNKATWKSARPATTSPSFRMRRVHQKKASLWLNSLSLCSARLRLPVQLYTPFPISSEMPRQSKRFKSSLHSSNRRNLPL